MNSEQLREFAGSGDLVQDNDAFFLPTNVETETFIRVIQLAAVRANPWFAESEKRSPYAEQPFLC